MKKLLFLIFVSVFIVSCDRDETENVSLGLRDYYNLPRFKKLELTSPYDGTHSWSIETPHGDSVISTSKDFFFISDKPGSYKVTYLLDDGTEKLKHTFLITVYKESPSIKIGLLRYGIIFLPLVSL